MRFLRGAESSPDASAQGQQPAGATAADRTARYLPAGLDDGARAGATTADRDGRSDGATHVHRLPNDHRIRPLPELKDYEFDGPLRDAKFEGLLSNEYGVKVDRKGNFVEGPGLNPVRPEDEGKSPEAIVVEAAQRSRQTPEYGARVAEAERHARGQDRPSVLDEVRDRVGGAAERFADLRARKGWFDGGRAARIASYGDETPERAKELIADVPRYSDPYYSGGRGAALEHLEREYGIKLDEENRIIEGPGADPEAAAAERARLERLPVEHEEWIRQPDMILRGIPNRNTSPYSYERRSQAEHTYYRLRLLDDYGVVLDRDNNILFRPDEYVRSD